MIFIMMESWILIILVVMPGVWSRNWEVTVGDQCAFKGTSVVLKCEYDYPSYHSVKSVSWTKALLVRGRYMLFHLPSSPPDHFKYVGNYQHDCSLEINNVQHTDEGLYLFSFKTARDRWTSKTFAKLSVTELMTIVEPSTVTEGNNVSLTCRLSGCFRQTLIVWFRDGQPVTTNPVFRARREDAGRYYCAVHGQEKVRSASVVLNVQYRPMNMTVSMDPPNVVEGSSVNLTCSSAANPAADSYTWYKRTASPSSSSQLLQVGSGQVLSLPSVEASDAGLYLCQARNHLGESNTTEVLLTVEGEENDGQSLQILSGIGVALSVTLVIAFLLFWMKQKTHAEKKAAFNIRLSGRAASSSSSEDQSNSVYANIHMFRSSLPPVAQDFTSRRNSHEEIYANTSYEDEVTYSTVTIKPRNPNLPHHMKNSKAPQDSRSTAGENNNSVIYATIAKSS